MGDEEDELPQTMCYMETMTKLLERALRQIEDLTEDAAGGATEAQIAEVQRRQTSPDRESEGHDAVRITIVINPGSESKIRGDAALDTLVGIQNRLRSEGDERLATVEYATNEELSAGGDS
jgi:hypothetical protein